MGSKRIFSLSSRDSEVATAVSAPQLSSDTTAATERGSTIARGTRVLAAKPMPHIAAPRGISASAGGRRVIGVVLAAALASASPSSTAFVLGVTSGALKLSRAAGQKLPRAATVLQQWLAPVAAALMLRKVAGLLLPGVRRRRHVRQQVNRYLRQYRRTSRKSRALQEKGLVQEESILWRQQHAKWAGHIQSSALKLGGMYAVAARTFSQACLPTTPSTYQVKMQRLQGPKLAVPLDRLMHTVAAALAEMGTSLEQAFLRVLPEAVAADGFCQVHRALLRDGSPVLLKVWNSRRQQRELQEGLKELQGIHRQLQREGVDLGFDAGKLLESCSQKLEASERGDSLAAAQNISMLRSLLLEETDPALSDIVLPAVHHQLTHCRMLVLEDLDGIPILDTAWMDLATRQHLLRCVLRAFGCMLLKHGMFPSNFHPGSLRALSRDGSTIQVGLPDPGSCCMVSASTRYRLAQLVRYLVRWDGHAISCCLKECGIQLQGCSTDQELLVAHLLLDTRIDSPSVFQEINGATAPPLKDVVVSGVPEDLLAVIRLVSALRGLQTAMGMLSELSSAVEWDGFAQEVLQSANSVRTRLSATPCVSPVWTSGSLDSPDFAGTRSSCASPTARLWSRTSTCSGPRSPGKLGAFSHPNVPGELRRSPLGQPQLAAAPSGRELTGAMMLENMRVGSSAGVAAGGSEPGEKKPFLSPRQPGGRQRLPQYLLHSSLQDISADEDPGSSPTASPLISRMSHAPASPGASTGSVELNFRMGHLEVESHPLERSAESEILDENLLNSELLLLRRNNRMLSHIRRSLGSTLPGYDGTHMDADAASSSPGSARSSFGAEPLPMMRFTCRMRSRERTTVSMDNSLLCRTVFWPDQDLQPLGPSIEDMVPGVHPGPHWGHPFAGSHLDTPGLWHPGHETPPTYPPSSPPPTFTRDGFAPGLRWDVSSYGTGDSRLCSAMASPGSPFSPSPGADVPYSSPIAELAPEAHTDAADPGDSVTSAPAGPEHSEATRQYSSPGLMHFPVGGDNSASEAQAAYAATSGDDRSFWSRSTMEFNNFSREDSGDGSGRVRAATTPGTDGAATPISPGSGRPRRRRSSDSQRTGTFLPPPPMEGSLLSQEYREAQLRQQHSAANAEDGPQTIRTAKAASEEDPEMLTGMISALEQLQHEVDSLIDSDG